MKGKPRAFAAAAILAFATVATLSSALAAGARSGTGGLATSVFPWGISSYGNGPVYYGEYAPLAYDSYAFAYEYPVYIGSDVTAIAVDLFNLRFRHRRSVGPGVIYYRGELQRSYHVNRYW